MTPKYLNPELRNLVSRSIHLLGEVILRQEGKTCYSRVEKCRHDMSQLRSASEAKKVLVLQKYLTQFQKLSQEERKVLVHSFSLMLELMNVCENAYRSHRNSLQAQVVERKIQAKESSSQIFEHSLYYVLTAHPTEARAPENLLLFRKIHQVLELALKSSFDYHEDELKSLIEAAYHLPITRQKKPDIRDEAEHIYSIVLHPEIIDEWVTINRQILPVYLRSWVGGDKDGHPGVNADKMRASLECSRAKCIYYLKLKLNQAKEVIELASDKSLVLDLNRLVRQLNSLRQIQTGDGHKILTFKKDFAKFVLAYVSEFGTALNEFTMIDSFLRILPAVLIPLEFRESSEVLVEAATHPEKSFAIVEMLKAIGSFSQGGDPRWYVRSLIISMASQREHMLAAVQLLERTFGSLILPVVPLFEQQESLEQSAALVKDMLALPQIRNQVKTFWNGQLEVMLGYSDSAKQVGVLKSRILIQQAVHDIDKVCKSKGVTPLFFHGSGGSVDRGGGSILEQISWLPAGSFKKYKATIQGEMVERTFSCPSILRAGILKFSEPFRTKGKKVSLSTGSLSKSLQKFSDEVSEVYQAQIQSEDFLRVIQRATPYPYLSLLRMGSRPSKRSKVLNVVGLRAIPWVLCWTQTRTLFPVWWGIGSAWKQQSTVMKRQLKKDFKNNALFRSYVKALGFTLAKVELSVWRTYLIQSRLSDSEINKIFLQFQNEFEASKDFVRTLSGETNLIWYRPWLAESIQLRTPMIHPINLLQILSLHEKDPVLIRETVAGIALGMLTTG